MAANVRLDILSQIRIASPCTMAWEEMQGGRVCARIRRRLDDTIILRDCPVGLARVRERTRQALARAVAFVMGGTTAVSAVILVVLMPRARAAHCMHCDHDLRESSSVRCPECGEPMPTGPRTRPEQL